MILWVSTRTSSFAARLAFALAGNPGEVREISLRAGEGRTPAFLALNPKGQVPVLQLDDGAALTETPAIMLALGELFPGSNLLGTTQMERWRVMEWLSWYAWMTPGNVLPGFAPGRFGPATAENAIREAALARTSTSLDFAVNQLDGRDWAVGARMSAADLVLAMLTVFAGFLNVAPPDALLAHRARTFATPEFKPVLAAEGMAA